MEKRMIISGLFCVGKTEFSKQSCNVIDLDSSIYYDRKVPNGLARYVDMAVEFLNAGNTVLISSHKEVREEMIRRNINYVFVTFENRMFGDVIRRSENRQPHALKTSLIRKEWRKVIKPLENEKYIKLTHEKPFLIDWVEHLIEMEDDEECIIYKKW